MKTAHRFGNGKAGSAITVRVTPRSGKDEITGILEDGTIKIRLKAPPVEGQANQELIKFLSDVLDIPPTRIEIISGANSKDKLVTILGLDSAAVQDRIMSQLG